MANVGPMNIFDNLPCDASAEHVETLLEDRTVKIERIVSTGQTTDWQTQDQNEWVTVLRGQAIVAFDAGKETHLTPGDCLHIPAQQKHRVSWTATNQETLWLAVHY
ncbi:MAG: cupin 2 domain-containing protein [Candidatus Marinamargulisbacteria bacterium]|jgi:cupin 2 domain-containing protein